MSKPLYNNPNRLRSYTIVTELPFIGGRTQGYHQNLITFRLWQFNKRLEVSMHSLFFCIK